MKNKYLLPGIAIAFMIFIAGCKKNIICEKFPCCEIKGLPCSPPPAENEVKIIARGLFSLLIDENHKLWGSGFNYHGCLGDGTEEDKFSPVLIMENVKSAAAGWQSTHILKDDNTVWACGFNWYGNLGDSTTTDRFTPVKIMDDVKAISAGYDVCLMLKNDNTLWATGENSSGEFGDGSNTGSLYPKKVMSDVKAIASGWYHSLILKSDNSLWETDLYKLTFSKIMDDVKTMAGGYEATLILKNDNSLWGKGYNWNGGLGDGSLIDRKTPVKIMDSVKAMAISDYHSMFLKLDNSLYVCGSNGSGQFGNGTKETRFDYFTSTPLKVMDNVSSIAAGTKFSLIIKTDGTILGAGDNISGALGDGTNQDRLTFSPAMIR